MTIWNGKVPCTPKRQDCESISQEEKKKGRLRRWLSRFSACCTSKGNRFQIHRTDPKVTPQNVDLKAQHRIGREMSSLVAN